MKHILLLLAINHPISGLQKFFIPEISQQKKDSSSYSIRAGQDVNLTCIIQVPRNGPLFKFDWKVEKEWGPRFVASPQSELESKSSDFLTKMRVLTIRNVEKVDTLRDYVCTYETVDFRSLSSTTLILLEKGEVKLNLISPQILPKTVGENATWIIQVKRTFKIREVLWHKTMEDGCVLNLSIYPESYVIKRGNSTVDFVIKTVSYEDYGDHRITFFSEDNQISTVKFTLKEREVFDYAVDKISAPIPFHIEELELNKRHFRLGEVLHAICRVAGSADVSISWYFSRCQRFADCLSSTNDKLFTISSSELETRPEESGRLTCAVSDGHVIKTRVTHICVTEFEAELALHGPTQAEEGEDVLFSCIASDCESIDTFDLTWYFKPNDTVFPKKISTGVNQSQGPSWKMTELRLKSVNRTYSGTYICEHNHIKFVLRESLRLTVYTGTALWPAYVVATFVALLAAIAFLWYFICHRPKKAEEEEFARIFEPTYPVQENIDKLKVDPKWEFPWSHLHIGKQIGFGFFGSVFEAEAEGIVEGEQKTTVAVKTGKSSSDSKINRAIIKEFKIMSHIGHHAFVVRLLGASVLRNEFFIIFQFCKYGSLHTYLLDNRDRFVQSRSPLAAEATREEPMPLNTHVLIGWSYQIARGMEWLGSRKVLHGDLAARNVLLTENNIVKICDFGLASDLYLQPEYKKRNSVQLPVKWTAIESLRDRIFSAQSDVWSYGVLLWELFSLGTTPYPEFPDFSELWVKIQQGYRMSKPTKCSDEIYGFMKRCWEANPKMRPTFHELAEHFQGLLSMQMRERYSMLEGEVGEATPDYCAMYNLSETRSERQYVNMPVMATPDYVPMYGS